MPAHDIVVVGASAGGVQPLMEMVERLPKGLRASLFVVVHSSPLHPGLLPDLLARHTPLVAKTAVDHEPIAPGHIYVPPPDHHLLVGSGEVRVVHGPRENGFRPAVDPLFRTAAATYGSRTIGVILSGALTDGTAGLAAIKEAGGIAVAQSADDATFASMPLSAVDRVVVDYVLPAADIAPLIARLALADGGLPRRNGRRNGAAHDPAVRGTDLTRESPPGTPSVFTCPDCGGALWEADERGLLHFRCHVGHGFTGDSLMAGHAEKIEPALWTAVRTLEESAALRRRMAERARQKQLSAIATAYEERAADDERRAGLIRNAMVAAHPMKPMRRPRTSRARRRRH